MVPRESGTPKVAQRSRTCVVTTRQTRAVTGAFDFAAAIWDIRLAMTPSQKLLTEVCAYRLRGIDKLNPDEMRLAGYGADTPEIDVCARLK